MSDFLAALVACDGEVESILALIARQVTTTVGDGCVLTTINPDGTSLTPRAVSHTHPEVERSMNEVLAGEETRIGDGVAGTVAAERRSILLNDLEPAAAAETTPAQFLPFVRDHPMRALIIVPMVAWGELIGTLGAVRTESAEPYEPADLELLEALADRAALAIADALAGPERIGPADYEAIFRQSMDGVLVTTPDGRFLAANPAACAILGRSEHEILVGGRHALLDESDPVVREALAVRSRSGHVKGELTLRRGDGSAFLADVSSTIFTTPDGELRASVLFRDITEEVRAREARLAELMQTAQHDPLTGLLNRHGFYPAAEQALAVADREEVTSQMVFLDVDGLKALNDELGHRAGDAALAALADAISRTVRHSDVACRFGGDEFLLLLVGMAETDAPEVVGRIREALLGGSDSSRLDFSAGIVERPAHDERPVTELIEAADSAMYSEKVVRRLRRR